MDRSLSKLQEIVKDREGWHTAVHGIIKTEKHGLNCVPTNLCWSPNPQYFRMSPLEIGLLQMYLAKVRPCGFLDFSFGKEPTCNAGDASSIPGLGRSPGEGKVYLLQYTGLENSMDCIVHWVTKSHTWLSDFHFSL